MSHTTTHTGVDSKKRPLEDRFLDCHWIGSTSKNGNEGNSNGNGNWRTDGSETQSAERLESVERIIGKIDVNSSEKRCEIKNVVWTSRKRKKKAGNWKTMNLNLKEKKLNKNTYETEGVWWPQQIQTRDHPWERDVIYGQPLTRRM